MTVVEDRPRLTPLAEAEDWLTAFDTALQAQDAAAAAGLVPRRRAVARRARLHLEHPDHGRPAGDRGHAARDAGAHQAEKLPHSAEAHAAALGWPRRHRLHRGALRIRHARSARATACCAWCRDRQGRLYAPGRSTPTCTSSAATKKRSSGARERRTRRATSAPKIGPTGSPRQRAFADRDPAVLVVGGGQAGLSHRGAAAAARHRHADRRPPRARRRQLAQALSLADAAQRSATSIICPICRSRRPCRSISRRTCWRTGSRFMSMPSS